MSLKKGRPNKYKDWYPWLATQPAPKLVIILNIEKEIVVNGQSYLIERGFNLLKFMFDC